MTSCAYPGCPSTGTHEHNGKLYCEAHLPKQHARPHLLPLLGKVDVEGRDN